MRIKKHRKLIQFLSMLVYNADVKNWFSGNISRSPLKNVCIPGLNCYSCPGAISSCPLGGIQNALASGKFPLLISGILLLFGTLFARAICAFLCPVGLIQELIYKIPTKKIPKTPKIESISQKLQKSKYIFLFLTIFLPLLIFWLEGYASPYFCKWICPAGTIEAGWPLVLLQKGLSSSIGFLFKWKSLLAILLIIWSLFSFRPFCKYICPLGAIYSFFNKFALFGIKVDYNKCTNCKACIKDCKMNPKNVNSLECIRCGECISKCEFEALSFNNKKSVNKTIFT